MDAPWHYGPTSEGKPAKTIEKIPLEWFYGDGVVLDFHKKERGSGITPDDLQAELKRIGYELKPFDIVLIRTDASKHYNEKNYEHLGIGVIEEATRWLIDQGIKVMGVDSYTWDKPHDCVLMITGKKYWPTPESLPGYEKVPPAPETGKLGDFIESHLFGRKREYFHAENLANLDKLPPFGFKVCLFPIKIENASGGWIRATAILED
jgi:kynurenine formamidase